MQQGAALRQSAQQQGGGCRQQPLQAPAAGRQARSSPCSTSLRVMGTCTVTPLPSAVGAAVSCILLSSCAICGREIMCPQKIKAAVQRVTSELSGVKYWQALPGPMGTASLLQAGGQAGRRAGRQAGRSAGRQAREGQRTLSAGRSTPMQPLMYAAGTSICRVSSWGYTAGTVGEATASRGSGRAVEQVNRPGTARLPAAVVAVLREKLG